MAEIHLERKRRSSWPVILAVALLLALFIWWLAGRGADAPLGIAPADTAVLGGTAMGETDTEMSSAVAVFLRWSDEREATRAMSPDHSYTATGIRNLAAALETLAGSDVDIEDEVATVHRQADTLWDNISSTRHADFTRKAFLTLSGLMRAVQQERAPTLDREVTEVRRAAEAVRADEPLLDQRTRVEEFFDRAATAVRRMSETTAR